MINGRATTIQVMENTRLCLEKLKVVKQEPYDNVIRRIIERVLDLCEEGTDLETKKMIQGRLNEVAKGDVISTKQLRDILFSGGEKNGEIRKGMGKVYRA